MKKSEVGTFTLSIISITIALVAIVSEEYRALIISIFSLFLVSYLLYDVHLELNKDSEEIKKLNEKLKIHKELIDIKADLISLKGEVFKK